MRRKRPSPTVTTQRATVNVAVAKAHLPELIERAARGEEIILSRAGKPRARLVPLEDNRKALRVPGKGKGRFRMTRDFDDPLPEAVLTSFEGSSS
jgi:prevent-host-death family protein